ncbi:hypothetical protein NKJ88_11690 [Mesorhizobium sp. M0016]|uniref:hypothetical protein n=1 Tax=Mesorhizobium sp. M0016 TaxID=2956843 RepID=UPI00333DAB4A
MATKLESDQEAIGRILEALLDNGLGSARFDSSRDGLKLLHMDDEQKAMDIFDDVLTWMADEGLIRVANRYPTLSSGTTWMGVQLSSKGLAALKKKPSENEKSVAETLSEKDGDLAPAAYSRLGALFGGFVGGAIQTLS